MEKVVAALIQQGHENFAHLHCSVLLPDHIFVRAVVHQNDSTADTFGDRQVTASALFGREALTPAIPILSNDVPIHWADVIGKLSGAVKDVGDEGSGFVLVAAGGDFLPPVAKGGAKENHLAGHIRA